MPESGDHADKGWDDYSERVLRNEARLEGLENLVRETREADRKLIEQRSSSLAQELERRAEALLELVTARADAVMALGDEERAADRREVQILIQAIKDADAAETALLREMYTRMIRQNFEQSQAALKSNHEQSAAAIYSLEQRRVAATHELEQMVRQWRESDKEARELAAVELARHLDVLNHSTERMSLFQANSVTRELWQSEKDASIARENILRDQIIAMDRNILTMVPISVADKTHAEMVTRMETSIIAASTVLDNKIGVVAEKVADLKEYRDRTQGRSSGYSALYGWIGGGLAILISVVVLANAFLS